MTRRLLSLALLALAAPIAAAQQATGADDPIDFPGGDRDAGVHSATLLRMGIGPRAIGIAQAMGAIEGDPTVIWYNTAGIARIRRNSFLITGSQGFANTQLAGAAVTFPTTLGTFGIAARAFNAGTIEETQNYDIVGRVRAYQFSLEGGGAIELARYWLWGGTLFYHQEVLGEESRGTVGLNSAMLFPDILGRLTLGAGVRNWGTPSDFEGEVSARPPVYGFVAGAFDLLRRRNLIQTPMLFRGQPIVADAKLVGQVNVPDRLEPYPMLGLEGTVNGVAIGRIGYMWGDDNQAGLTLGAGINVGQFRLEYAFRNRHNLGAGFFENDVLGDEHHVSAAYFWGDRATNQPVVPVIVTQPLDTAAVNRAIREAIQRELAAIGPLLDSLRRQQVEITQRTDLIAEYVVPVHFGFDSAVVREEDIAILGQVAEVIRRVYPSALVTITGFADPAGSPRYNLELSRRRAAAVRDVLVNRFGVPAGQLRTVGYGEQPQRLVVPGAARDEPGALLNRRVTFTIDATQPWSGAQRQ